MRSEGQQHSCRPDFSRSKDSVLEIKILLPMFALLPRNCAGRFSEMRACLPHVFVAALIPNRVASRNWPSSCGISTRFNGFHREFHAAEHCDNFFCQRSAAGKSSRGLVDMIDETNTKALYQLKSFLRQGQFVGDPLPHNRESRCEPPYP